MSDKIIVMVSDLDDGAHGEINVLEGADDAVHLVETLLQSGFDRDRIRVFAGSELIMQISHRPVVSLLGTEPASAPAEAAEDESASEVAAPTAQRSAAIIFGDAAEPFVRNGVRFSSQFRPA